MVESERPKSFPDEGDVGDGGALSSGAPVPLQKAQLIIDLFLLNGFWINSEKKRKEGILLTRIRRKGIHIAALILVVAIGSGYVKASVRNTNGCHRVDFCLLCMERA